MKKPRILVVDANADDLLATASLLRANKFEILPTSNPAEVLELARHESPDLILMDVVMPVMNGWMLLKRLEKDDHTAGIPLIVYSKYVPGGNMSKAYVDGAFEYVTKLIGSSMLLTVVKRVLKDVGADQRQHLRYVRRWLQNATDDALQREV